MKTIIAGLKWVAKFLENRFPEKIDVSQLASKAEVELYFDSLSEKFDAQAVEIVALRDENKKFKEQFQIISLRVGLARPMQTVLKEKF